MFRSTVRFFSFRLIWTGIVSAATILGVCMSIEMWFDWKASPVVTTIGTTALPIADLNFPAVTLCSPGNGME